ncbi:MAG: PP2C family protein-serine/threonine phosphatase, partial [Pseudobdellovibrionaceae bacterium]
YKTFLLDRNGAPILGPEEDQEASIPPEFIKRARESQLVSGTESVKIGKDNELLASYAKVGFADLMVASFVDKAVALSAVQILIRKSLLFFGMLISVTVMISLLASQGLTSSLTKLFKATRSVAEGNFDIKVSVKSSDEIGSLAASFNKMAEEVKRLLMETAETARMQNELQTAQTVQETLFPPARALIKNLEIAGFYTPASECGGDWWHYCEIGSRVYLWIGDATGHGAPAALITAAAKSAATIIERLNVGPGQALDLLNRAIADVSKGKIMMTFFLAAYDTETHKLTYSNASHEPPILMKQSENPLKKKDLIVLNDVNSSRLGQDRETKFDEASIDLDPGDLVLFYTDGIPDLENRKKESIGERDFLKWVVEVNKDFPTADDSVNRMVDKIKTHREDAPLKDDITFFVVKRSI